MNYANLKEFSQIQQQEKLRRMNARECEPMPKSSVFPLLKSQEEIDATASDSFFSRCGHRMTALSERLRRFWE